MDVDAISTDDIARARERIAPWCIRTPLLPLADFRAGPTSPAEVRVKLECLQPIGSFKIRGAANRLAAIEARRLEAGVWTASAGNMAQGVGWMARALGVPFTVVVPDHAPQTKLHAIEALGGTIIPVEFERWWDVLETHRLEGLDGVFVHPVCDPGVVAGNGTIGLEILEQWPEVDTVLVPYGGGGLISGVARAMRSSAPRMQTLAAEVSTAAPLAAALDAGAPVLVEHTPSFVDGIGGRRVLDAMWPMVRALVDGSVVVTPGAIAAAMRRLATRQHVVAEGAGAASVAAALSGDPRLAGRRVACVVSGGNVDASVLAAVLEGRL